MYGRTRRYTRRVGYRKPYSSSRKPRVANRGYVKKFRGAAARGIKRVVQRQIETKEYTNGVQSQLAPTALGAFGAGYNAATDAPSYFKPVTLIGQGDTRAGRTGDDITLMSIEWRYCINYSDYQQELVLIMAFTAPLGYAITYGNIFETSDGHVDVRTARPSPNITVLKKYWHVFSPLNSATASDASINNTPSVFRRGVMRLNFKGGRRYRYEYSDNSSTVYQNSRNREIVFAAISYGSERIVTGSTLSQFTAFQSQELSIRFKDA